MLKEKMNQLSRLLMALHRTLLHYEKDLHEKREQRSFTPHEMLHLSLNDPHFEWLRRISDLIVLLDTRVDDKEELKAEDLGNFCDEARELFFGQAPEQKSFHEKMMAAVSADSALVLQLADLRNFLKLQAGA